MSMRNRLALEKYRDLTINTNITDQIGQKAFSFQKHCICSTSEESEQFQVGLPWQPPSNQFCLQSPLDDNLDSSHPTTIPPVRVWISEHKLLVGPVHHAIYLAKLEISLIGKDGVAPLPELLHDKLGEALPLLPARQSGSPSLQSSLIES